MNYYCEWIGTKIKCFRSSSFRRIICQLLYLKKELETLVESMLAVLASTKSLSVFLFFTGSCCILWGIRLDCEIKSTQRCHKTEVPRTTTWVWFQSSIANLTLHIAALIDRWALFSPTIHVFAYFWISREPAETS